MTLTPDPTQPTNLSSPRPVLDTKGKFRDAWMHDRLGNRLRSWSTYDELVASGYAGCVAFRLHVPSNQHPRYHVPLSQIPATIAELEKLGVYESSIWFGESAPDGHLTLQGEYLDGVKANVFYNNYLMYSRARTQMKTAMALPLDPTVGLKLRPESRFRVEHFYRCQSEGLRTKLLLQSVMNANSYEDFLELRELYPGHVIEFSCYDHCLGNMPDRNTIIWEVRAY